MSEPTPIRCKPGDIMPMSIGTAFEHINACMRRRGFVQTVTGEQTEQGYRFTVQRLGQYRLPVDIPVMFRDTTIDSPVTDEMLAQYAIAVGLGRRGERPSQHSRNLMRQTALYMGTDGHYHITGVPDRVFPAATPAVVERVALRLA